MPVTHEKSNNGKDIQIIVHGRFDHRVSQKFRDIYRHDTDHEGITYHVDLSAADYMDSSALGMLLLLREHAKDNGGKVLIERPSEKIDNVLKLSDFGQLFTINKAAI